jgi:hypothetical protein
MRGLPHCWENQLDKASISIDSILASATDLGSGKAVNLLKKCRKTSSISIDGWISHDKAAPELGILAKALLGCN